jgi:hypothetical protein
VPASLVLLEPLMSLAFVFAFTGFTNPGLAEDSTAAGVFGVADICPAGAGSSAVAIFPAARGVA